MTRTEERIEALAEFAREHGADKVRQTQRSVAITTIANGDIYRAYDVSVDHRGHLSSAKKHDSNIHISDRMSHRKTSLADVERSVEYDLTA